MFPTWFVSIIPSSPSSPLALCNFGTAKVCDENVHVFVQKDIFRFQVSMNDALVMQIFHGSHQFCGVELCAVYGFCCQLGNELEQVSILGIGENKVQPLRVLEFGTRENSMLVIYCPDSFYRGLLGRIKAGTLRRIWARQGPIFFPQIFWPVVSYKSVLKPKI